LLDTHKIGLGADGGYKVSPTPLLGGPPPPLSYYNIRHPYTAIAIAYPI
jgi:hypothetical protein